jgi:beta-xylosidase
MQGWVLKRACALVLSVVIVAMAAGCTLQGGGKKEEEEPAVPMEVVDEDGTLVIGADPKVLRAGDGMYYMYTTEENREVPTWRSEDLTVWTKLESAVSRTAYVATGGADDADKQRIWEIWAPYVFELDGQYVMLASGRIAEQMPTEGSIHRSTFAAVSDSPEGPFEKFYKIMPRESHPSAPHSVINVPDPEEKAAPNFDEHAVLSIDASVFVDPVSGKHYMAYVSYGDPAVEQENGNHIQLFALNGAAFEDNEAPAFYYDFDPEDSFEIADPQAWPEFEDVPMSLEKTNSPWHPRGGEWGDFGYERFVNEAPALFYDNGWYSFYFSVNTWDSPSYQILEVRTKKLEQLRAAKRDEVSSDDIRFRVFQAPAATNNYGSGSVVQGPDGDWVYFMHSLIPGSVRTLWSKKIVVE